MNLEKKYIKLILILILFDAVSTIFWYSHQGVDEANPIMRHFIERSTVEFIIAKLGISFMSLGVLSFFSDRGISKIGIIIIMIVYILVALMHICALFII